jgi:preprotein translocase subunit SecE
MSQDNSSAESSVKNNKYYVMLSLLVMGAGIVLYYATEHSFSSIWRILGLVGVGVISLVIIYLSELGKRALNFIGGARTEVLKVIWPTRQETIQMSLIVIVAVFVIGLFLWLVDTLFLWLVEYLINL